MILTDYFRSERDSTWDFAVASGVRHGVIRLPEQQGFDYGDRAHWDRLVKAFTDFGITPVAIEPMPNELHDHIKAGDALRDESIEKVISMFPHMQAHGIDTICFNFMAHIGWLRTSSTVSERGGATVTEFNAWEKILKKRLKSLPIRSLWYISETQSEHANTSARPFTITAISIWQG